MNLPACGRPASKHEKNRCREGPGFVERSSLRARRFVGVHRESAGVASYVTLLDPPPCGFSRCSCRRCRVCVLQFLGSKGRDQSLLVAPDKIRENAAFNMCNDRLVRLVDRVRAKTSNETRQNRLVLVGCAFICRPGCEFRKVGTRDELRKVTVRVKHENPLRKS